MQQTIIQHHGSGSRQHRLLIPRDDVGRIPRTPSLIQAGPIAAWSTSTIEEELDIQRVLGDGVVVLLEEFIDELHPQHTASIGERESSRPVGSTRESSCIDHCNEANEPRGTSIAWRERIDLEAQCNVQSLARLKGRDALRRDQVREDIIGARVVALGGHWGIVCQQEAASLFGGGVLRHVALFGAH